MKKKSFDTAYDLARGIADGALRDSTVERINRALAFVKSKEATK